MFFFTNLCPALRIVPEYLINERKEGREGWRERIREGRREGGRKGDGNGRMDKEREEDKESVFTLMKFTRLGMIPHR